MIVDRYAPMLRVVSTIGKATGFGRVALYSEGIANIVRQ